MVNFLRGTVIGLLALASLALVAATAAATGTLPVRINTGASTASLGDTTFSVLTSAGLRGLACRAMKLLDTLSSSGSFSAGTVTFDTCTFSGLSATVAAANQPWAGTIRHLDNSILRTPSAFTIDITGIALNVAVIGCTFTLSGNILGSAAISANHGALVTIPPFAFPALLQANPLTLLVSNTTGCGAFSVLNGNLAAFIGMKTFGPALVGAAL